MELRQVYPLRYFALVRFEAGDSKVVEHYKSLFYETTVEYEYDDLGSSRASKWGEDGWGGFGAGLLVLFWLSSMLTPRKIYIPFEPVVVFMVIICFLLMFVKINYIEFLRKDGSRAFVVKIPSKNNHRAMEFVNFVKSKLAHASQ